MRVIPLTREPSGGDSRPEAGEHLSSHNALWVTSPDQFLGIGSTPL